MILICFVALSARIYVAEDRSPRINFHETDDEYCRRKSREYARLADEVVRKKRDKAMLKQMKVSTGYLALDRIRERHY